MEHTLQYQQVKGLHLQTQCKRSKYPSFRAGCTGRTCSQARPARSVQEASKGVQAARETNTCTPGDVHESTYGGQTGHIHVAMQGVQAVKPAYEQRTKYGAVRTRS